MRPVGKRPTVSRVVAILGMHRSGTSALAGCLEEAGLHLGETATANRNNPRGNRENRQILALHKSLLRANGGSWDRPPEQVRWKLRHRWARNRIISRLSRHPAWGFKDPRALLTLDGWLEALPNLQCVGIFRHPQLVAASLKRRNGFSLDRGLALWLHYNRRLLHYHDHLAFPLISFDETPERYDARVRVLARELDIGLDPARIRFFDPALRHAQSEESAPLPAACEQLYAELRERSR